MSRGDLFMDAWPQPKATSPLAEITERDAFFSPCRTWRYSLTRSWGEWQNPLVCIGLNPSTADETQDDPTIRRVIGFARSWGHDGLVMLNLFGYRSTDPAPLRRMDRGVAVGPENDAYIALEAEGRRVLCAWGVHGEVHGRAHEVYRTLKRAGVDLVCLGLTKAGSPRHPLYVPAVEPHRAFVDERGAP